MPQAVEQHSTNSPRRSPSAVGGASKRRRLPSAPAALRAKLEQLIEEAFEALDALDAAHADMEPDADGEAEVDEANAQPATLSPDRGRAVTSCPSARQQRAAYRRNGDPIPANLRRFGGALGRTRA